jgi:hypothetical protein
VLPVCEILGTRIITNLVDPSAISNEISHAPFPTLHGFNEMSHKDYVSVMEFLLNCLVSVSFCASESSFKEEGIFYLFSYLQLFLGTEKHYTNM